MSIESMMPSSYPILHLPPSLSALNLSQHQGLFQIIGSSPQVAKVLAPLRDLPNPGIEPMSLVSPALAGGFLMTSATWEALLFPVNSQRSEA